MKFKKSIKIEGKLKVLTGLHIGGIKEAFKIGGLDNPFIKIKKVGEAEEPYIPGSSLKGKIRCLLELEEGKEELCSCGNCMICKLFGPHKSEKKEPSRVIFRDAYLEENCRGKEILEIKPENIIHRCKGTAEHPRFIERVVPGTVFKVEILLNVFEDDNEKEMLEKLKHGFELLQENYLGGSGTRGYGKVDVNEIIENIKKIQSMC
ncbi:MAG: type III-A CRISPR-associated RAMP protein Csm3 [Candidatus Parvarchaeota archaeon]|nr:type III-A CRISPR-associated RAMP protein Csm3 [Candidatus Jingweiarchaeum tengchongense]MCW1305503.1 type III-A CRISPR-associated RAMP protein Csm3 [Candidatus Jingweiarchaeum tengchongense]